MSTPNPTHIDVIIEHRWRDGKGCNCTWFPDYRNTHKSGLEMHGEHVVSKLTDAGYSIVSTAPGTCVDDPMGTHRWVTSTLGIPPEPGWKCVDCHRNSRKDPFAAAEGEKP